MPLKKLQQKAGVNRENTRYTNENGYYVSDKVRFRQGTPEKIGGWNRINPSFFVGVCRSLWNWVTLGGANLLGVGTNLKFYIESDQTYYDITPIRASSVINNNPFTLTASTTVTVTDTAHGAIPGDFVTFSGAVNIGGAGTNVTAAVLNKEFQIVAVPTADTYTIVISVVPNATAIAGSPGGGAAVTATYQINVGEEFSTPVSGWGAGGWGVGGWGVGSTSPVPIRLWSQSNFGENLVFGYRGGQIYYWDNLLGFSARGVLVSSLGGAVTFTAASPTVVTSTKSFSEGTVLQFNASSSMPSGVTAGVDYYVTDVEGVTFKLLTAGGSAVNAASTGSGVYISNVVDVPIVQNYLIVSDASRFVFAFGCNDYGSVVQNQMLLRWSDQENILQWTPNATNQAGSLLLSHGSKIVTALQTRQEIVVFTDSSLYSLQYQGPPVVWGSQLLGDNISIAGPNAAAIGSGVIYWMGVDKFYKYDGRIQTLRCDLRKYIYSDINFDQSDQFFASTNEGFNEVWFFYCSAGSNRPNRYVIYNYAEDVWMYGNMERSAWLDTGLRDYPLAATYINNVVYHEFGNDDNSTDVTLPIAAVIETTEFDIDDGDHFGFVWRILPDITFVGTDDTVANPQVTMTLIPMQNSGSGYNNPISVGGNSNAVITRTSTVVIEQFTGQVYVRVRGRQMILKVESNQVGCSWQLGSPRIDIRQDGRRGNS
jgi:hypothetical protein